MIIEPETGLRWEPTTTTLKFMFGEFVLRRLPLAAIVCRTHFLSMPPDLAVAPPARALAIAGREVAVIRSCPVAGIPAGMARFPGYLRYVQPHYHHYMVRCTGTFDQYLATFKAKTRSGLKRKVRRFMREFPAADAFREYRHPSEMATFLDYAHQIAKDTYQERLLGRALPTDPASQAELRHAAERNETRGYLLFAGERPVAFILAPILAGHIALYDYVGFDQGFARFSPGTVLQYHVLERLFAEESIDFYDLCEGEGEHKRMLATEEHLCADVYFFPRRFRFLVAISAHRALVSITAGFVHMTSRLGVKARLKKLLRKKH